MIEYEQQFYTLIDSAIEYQASDILLGAGRYPSLRINGKLTPFTQMSVVNIQNMQDVVHLIADEKRQKTLEQDRVVDFAYSYKDTVRFRVNLYHQFGSIAAALRIISPEVFSLEDLKLPSILNNFVEYRQGLVLVTGPTGSGKSTTLRTLIETVNQQRSEHIIMFEEPIEHIFSSKKSIIDQIEIGRDVDNLETAAENLFHQDPDIVVVGDMRNIETMALTMNVAETGHLVFVTLHTNSAAETIDRILNSCPANQRNQVRSQLATTLVGVISQRLLPSLRGGRVPAVEVLFANSAVRNLIRADKAYAINTVLETGREQGMIAMKHALSKLMYDGEISTSIAHSYSLQDKDLSTRSAAIKS